MEHFGIPSFVVVNDGEELGRLVNKIVKPKTKSLAFATSRRVGDCYVHTIISKYFSWDRWQRSSDGSLQKALAVAKRNQGTVYVANVIDHQIYTFMSYSPLNENIMDQLAADAKELINQCKAIGRDFGYTKIEGIIAYGSAKEAMAKTLPKNMTSI